MAQTLFLPTPTLSYTPSSPDPTPLRMLAFSVAEAALQPDPNSPLFEGSRMVSAPLTIKRNARWSGGDWVSSWASQSSSASAPKASLWDLAERAKDRKASPSPPPESPPISPATYHFVLPANSPLAASVQENRSPRRPTHLNLLPRFPLETRSAEPSPTNSTFSSLDQSRPPPEFVPRLTGKEFSVQSRQVSAGKHTRTKSVDGAAAAGSPKPRTKLPSLAQIQAKIRNAAPPGIAGAVPMPRPGSMRTSSEDSFELQTPTEERPSLAILGRRPPTPPSPPAPAAAIKEKIAEPRLAPFLRERTSGRIAMSTPPRSRSPGSAAGADHPVLRITPPSASIDHRPQGRRVISLNSPTKSYFPPCLPAISPTESRFSLAVHTPPPQSTTTMSSRASASSPVSPAGSIRSSASASPTLSVPRITCTPAPIKVVKDGVEQDSDQEEDDVVVFDGEMEEAKERKERERRGQEMRNILRLRRPSD